VAKVVVNPVAEQLVTVLQEDEVMVAVILPAVLTWYVRNSNIRLPYAFLAKLQDSSEELVDLEDFSSWPARLARVR